MKARKQKLGINMESGWIYSAYHNRGQGLSPLIVFFQFIMHFAYYILYLWTYFKETYIVVALQVEEGVVAQKGPTAHNSWSYVPWYVFK